MFDMPNDIGRTYRGIKRIEIKGGYETTATSYPEYDTIDFKPLEKSFFVCDFDAKEYNEPNREVLKCQTFKLDWHGKTIGFEETEE